MVLMDPKFAIFVGIASLLVIAFYSSSSNVSAVKMFCGYINANTHRCVFIYDDLTITVVDCTTNPDKTRTCERPTAKPFADLPPSIKAELENYARQEGETIEDAVPHKGIDSKIPLAPK